MRHFLIVLGLLAPLALAAPASADLGPGPGPSSSSGAGGSGGDGGKGGDGGTDGSTEAPPAEESGCAIVAPGAATYGAAGVWLLGLGALALSRRSRRRA